MERPFLCPRNRVSFALNMAIGAVALLATVDTAQAAPEQPDTPKLFVDYDDNVLDNYIGASAELTATTNSVSGAARYEWDILDGTVTTTRPSVARGVLVFGAYTTASVKVRAVDGEGNAGPWSSTASTNIYSSARRPNMPTLSFSTEDQTITISGYEYRNATQYTIKITAPGGRITRKEVTDTEYAYAVPVSDPSGTWKVSVQATTATRRTAFSRTAVLPVNVPEQPVELAAEAGNGQVTLTWKDPGDSGITKYQLRLDYGEWADIEGSDAGTTSHTVMGLTNGTAYRFQIRAASDSGAGEASESVSTTPVALPKPTGLAATSDDGQVTLTWEDPGDASIAKYQLQVDHGEWADIEGSDAGTTSHTVTGLTNGTEYRFQIRAVSGSGVGEASETVSAYPGPVPELAASVPSPLTEATLSGSVVTLTLSGGTYEHWNAVRNNVTVSGIDGVTFRSSTDVERLSDTEVTVKLSFRGNIDTDATLTFTVGASAIAAYTGPPLTAEIPVTAVEESLVASTPQPLTETTLNGSVVTLTLSSGTFASWNTVRNNLAVSGIDGVTFRSTTDVERVSDTEVTIKLAFNGNIDTDTTLTFTVGASAIAGYAGPALTAEIPVTAVAESVVASAPQPLTETTLDGSVVTLTLSSGTFERWNTVRNNVKVSGIEGVTFRSTSDVERLSDTEVTIELAFNGNIDTDTTLTFTVGASAIAGYAGSALTAEIPVSADEEATPDFNGDGKVGFSDFILFAAVFGSSRGDAGYEARYDLDGDSAIGFGDFLIFAGSFGKDVPSSDSGGGEGGGGSSQACAVGLALNPGDGCSGSGYSLRNDAGVLVADGTIGGITMDNTRFSGGSVQLNRLRLTRSGNVWTLVGLP